MWGDVRGLRGLELRARSDPLLDLILAMKRYGKTIQSPPVTSGERKFEGFWPLESQDRPEGKARFPLGAVLRLSPDAKHPGWRPKDAGPEAQR